MNRIELNYILDKINNVSRSLLMMQQAAELALQLQNELSESFIKFQQETEALKDELAMARQVIAGMEKEHNEIRTAQLSATKDMEQNVVGKAIQHG